MFTATDLIIATGAGIALLTLVLIYMQVRWDHQRSRRTKAWDILHQWTQDQTHPMTAAAKIVNSLGKENLEDLAKTNNFKLRKEYLPCVRKCQDDPEIKDLNPIVEDYGHEVLISSEISAEIKWHAIEYLDAVEVVLIAWDLRIVTESIIVEEMKLLFSRGALLKGFRELQGGPKAYPAIYKFEDHLAPRQGLRFKALGRLLTRKPG